MFSASGRIFLQIACAWFVQARVAAGLTDTLGVLHDPDTAQNETEVPISIIPLNKQYVPVVRGNRTVMYKTAYFGNVYIGLPSQQKFTVVFDSGSGHFFVPSSACNNVACNVHRRFDANASESALAIDHDGHVVPKTIADRDRDQVSIAFGTGEVLGDFVRDVVCLSDHSGESKNQALQQKDCVQVRVVTAIELTEEPFAVFEFDGVMGLGLQELALDPEFSFFGQMLRLNDVSRHQRSFGVFISDRDTIPSEISFGGYDKRRTQGPLEWAPVTHPALGYWQVSIKSVRIGDTTMSICDDGTCVAIVDSGSSLIGVPKDEAQQFHWKLARKVEDGHADVDCRDNPGPDMVFDLGGLEITMGPKDYSRPAALQVVSNKTDEIQVICRASLLPVDMSDALQTPKVFIFGEPVLRKYYTNYDWGEKRVGFALANPPNDEHDVEQSHQVFGAPESDKPPASIVSI